MKECPLCRQVYADDTLNFCLSDGTGLARIPDVSDETIKIELSAASEKTLVLKSPVPTHPVEIKQTEQIVSKGVNPLFAYLSVGLIALITGGGLIFWLTSGGRNLPTNEQQSANISNSTKASGSTSSQKAPPDALVQQSQKLAVNLPQVDTNKVANTPSAARPPAVSGGTWFIVLGSFPKSQSERANRRLKYVQGLGIEASIVDTDNYPGFRSGLYAVVLGPFSKGDARSRLASMKSAVPDAYAKSGF